MYQYLAGFFPNQNRADLLMNEVCFLIYKKQISSAYQLLLVAYDYLLSDNQGAQWSKFQDKERITTLSSAAYFNSVYKNGLKAASLNNADVLFDNKVYKMYPTHEINFVKAFAHKFLNDTFSSHLKRDGLKAIEDYLSEYPSCKKGYYLKATLLKRCFNEPERDFKVEALAAVETALKLKNTFRGLILKSEILEDIVFCEDSTDINDEAPLLVLLGICTSCLSSEIPFANLHTYSRRRNISLPLIGDNKLLKLFNIDGYEFKIYLNLVLYRSIYANHPVGNESANYRTEHNEFLSTVKNNKKLFLYDSYKMKKAEKIKFDNESKKQENLNFEENDSYDGYSSNEYYDDNLDMDQQSLEFWDNL